MNIKNIIKLALVASICHINTAVADEYVLADAERFAKLFKNKSATNQALLKSQYLVPGSTGVDIFTPGRIKNAKNLALAVSNNQEAYQKAVDVCFPAAQNMKTQATETLKAVQVFLGQKDSAPTFILFGANNSGGTANEKGLSLGLEVICRFADTQEQAKEVLLGFVAHEIVHVYQSRNPSTKEVKYTLLRQALMEGFADFVTYKAMGKVTESEKDRHEYGLKNEAKLWAEFKTAMNGKTFKPWMYDRKSNDRPRDLGYWIGKRIAKAYYEQSNDKASALNHLLILDDPMDILTASGYNPQ